MGSSSGGADMEQARATCQPRVRLCVRTVPPGTLTEPGAAGYLHLTDERLWLTEGNELPRVKRTPLSRILSCQRSEQP